VHNLSFKESLEHIITMGLQRKHGFVCFANVHMTIEAYKSRSFREDLKTATFVLADGKPLAIACKWLYNKRQERIAGMDFMPTLLEEANRLQAKVFLYGSTQQVLNKLLQQIQLRYPKAQIVGAVSPPFRQLSEKENQEYIDRINQSGAHFILVALGCPKQEKWMAKNYHAISGMLLGVGGAFPVLACTQKRAPKWMSNNSLEWFYRLMQEPKRLFKRYFYTNTLFIYLLLRQLIKQRMN
jgi:N-acetylglucosaminyldiphosphoundecaprenol N-acetyl-beta-D-mannosaminyltransferase